MICSLRQKCHYSESFWSAFSRIRTEYGEIRSIYKTSFSKKIEILLKQCNENFWFQRRSSSSHNPGRVLISNVLHILPLKSKYFRSVWVFFHKHSRITGLQGKGEGISLSPHYHFHPLHRHLVIRRAIAAESLPLAIASSRTQTGNLCFLSASR